MKRIPSLDGLRAISVLAVISGHLAGSGGLPVNTGILSILERFPNLGVRVFFVLSGFLITTLILEEQVTTGSFSLLTFYKRRAWRIIPPAYALLTFVAIASLFHFFTIDRLDFLRSLTYLINYGPTPSWPVGHLWSLSVEEQFYLIWPFLLFFLSTRLCRFVALGFIVVSAILRYHLVGQSLQHAWRLEHQFQYAGTAMAFGCLLAIDRKWLASQPWYQTLGASPFTAPLTCGVMVANSLILRTSGPVGLCSADIITNLSIVILVYAFTTRTSGAAFRFLNFEPVVFIGTISYSLYLWQQIFTLPGGSGWIFRFPINIFLIFTCALGSYYLIEKPSLRIRQKLQVRRANPTEAKPPFVAIGSVANLEQT